MGVKDADSHKLGFHPTRVARWKQQDGIDMPLHAEIGLTDRCNHNCNFCTLDWITHGSKELAYPVVCNVISDLKSLGVKSIYLAGEGEPTLHTEFSRLVKEIKFAGLSVAVSTNGARYNRNVCDNTLRFLSWIRFSVDSVDCDIYKRVHGVKEGQLRDVKNNISYAVSCKLEQELNVDIGVQIVLTEDTVGSMEDTIEFFKMLGVDNVQIKPCHNHPNSTYEPSFEKEISYDDLKERAMRYVTDDFEVIFRSKSMERLTEPRNWTRCHGFDFYVLISANGDVVPCNVFYGKKDFIYGNVYNETFYDIWTGKKRRDIIDKITESSFSNCGDYRCRLDVINRYLHRVVCPERNDEFI